MPTQSDQDVAEHQSPVAIAQPDAPLTETEENVATLSIRAIAPEALIVTKHEEMEGYHANFKWQPHYGNAFAGGSPAFITLNDRKYVLKEFHMHFPAEHPVVAEDGSKIYHEGVVHYFLQAEDGTNAVLSVFIKENPRKVNLAANALLENLPSDINPVFSINSAYIRPASLIPGYNPNSEKPRTKEMQVLRYGPGSATTNPHVEVDDWLFMDHAISMSTGQLKAFRKALGVSEQLVRECPECPEQHNAVADGHGNDGNHRPLQKQTAQKTEYINAKVTFHPGNQPDNQRTAHSPDGGLIGTRDIPSGPRLLQA